ncbi:unnamed protein product [Linum trigynum]|uniref:Uncharacterized protein n=1 Tax=Linum trigynum TaxID=586398 RepID=A0AAV2F497_9ROSI
MSHAIDVSAGPLFGAGRFRSAVPPSLSHPTRNSGQISFSSNIALQSPRSSRSARWSRSNFTYSFPVNPGQKFIRLYFFPTTYSPDFNKSAASFSVVAGQFALLDSYNLPHPPAIRQQHQSHRRRRRRLSSPIRHPPRRETAADEAAGTRWLLTAKITF